jgi:protein-L-isoaspartate(D-aspartate) O-methyltransferase
MAAEIAARGVTDERVLDALRSVSREAFVAHDLREFAYEDRPLPTASGQTISQPYVVALMLQALSLRATDRALEVGTGSGWASALLARLVAEVYTIERHPELAEGARARFRALGLSNVEVRAGDGTFGWPERAPFDAILVSAGGPTLPPALPAQLARGGRLVIPLGPFGGAQRLTRLLRGADGELEREDLGEVFFVPLVAGT